MDGPEFGILEAAAAAAGGLGAVVLSQFVENSFLNNAADPIAFCDGCFCIPEPGEPCPLTRTPKTDFDQATIDALFDQTPLNPIGLTCDPFTDDTCETSPPQDAAMVALGENAVCGLLYSDSSCSSYTMQTYESRTAAEAAGAFVTHVGACGVCSTTQDLATYLAVPDLANGARQCSTISTFEGFDLAAQCFQDFGFSEPCAVAWAYVGRSVGSNCLLPCVALAILDAPNNGPPPECKLDGCHECDEDVNGERFAQFVGRIRRTTGLLSAIARPCSAIADITHVACPNSSS